MLHARLTRTLRRPALTLLVPMLFLLTACGSGLSGKYADEMGIMEYEFDSDGTVYMNAMGTRVAGEYEIDDNNVIVHGPHGNLVFERKDDQLIGPMGLILSRRD
ncbi:type I restriction-modification system methyltransferase subunit [Thiohalobacter thiocyanaticus]|uniref:Type I restriction-modification system methyltransferase subunit n=1 Tax=Thiohalobacter thiocyanaticus TaxID=585455 RepID=A0A1Z4VTW3_9GAMM|nr:hypothetical protein [Thiohalobacter thiocyanaticus]BAZ94778.1 type I restriction-modification system methyltransferase subunit [Thiohalobacter thiocyanaticus]